MNSDLSFPRSTNWTFGDCHLVGGTPRSVPTVMTRGAEAGVGSPRELAERVPMEVCDSLEWAGGPNKGTDAGPEFPFYSSKNGGSLGQKNGGSYISNTLVHNSRA